MGKIIQFRLKSRPSRQQALQWLFHNYYKFPSLDGDKISSDEIFHGWKFIKGIDNVVYFANCMSLLFNICDCKELKSKDIELAKNEALSYIASYIGNLSSELYLIIEGYQK